MARAVQIPQRFDPKAIAIVRVAWPASHVSTFPG